MVYVRSSQNLHNKRFYYRTRGVHGSISQASLVETTSYLTTGRRTDDEFSDGNAYPTSGLSGGHLGPTELPRRLHGPPTASDGGSGRHSRHTPRRRRRVRTKSENYYGFTWTERISDTRKCA